MQTTDKVPPEHCQVAALLSKKTRQLKIAERQFMEDCRTYINSNPIAVLSVAVGTGFVLSRLLSHHQTASSVIDTK
ncbi:MAG: DUF883 domain-containing protein [Methylovulum sp.]|nr:DUF883 domain-containing protein [Methylovulum sp.]